MIDSIPTQDTPSHTGTGAGITALHGLMFTMIRDGLTQSHPAARALGASLALALLAVHLWLVWALFWLGQHAAHWW